MPSQVTSFTLCNSRGVEATVLNYGGIVSSLKVPDRNGAFADVVLGFAGPQDYVRTGNKPFFGAIIGRYGNRIDGGRFTLSGKHYQLATNNGPNHLHGGIVGFDKVFWSASLEGDSSLRLSYRSPHGEEGYPGNVDAEVTYTLGEDNDLAIEYRARTDQATPLNLTNHSYFNLSGEGSGTILSHQLKLHATHFVPVNGNLIPTGEVRSVAGTPFDFTTSKAIGRSIAVDDEQLRFANGYDHTFVHSPIARGLEKCAEVTEPVSGRVMEVLTTEPGVQFYTGNFLDGQLVGKSGHKHVFRSGFCLETQHFPDSPNQPNFPSTILLPGKEYVTKTVYRFSAR